MSKKCMTESNNEDNSDYEFKFNKDIKTVKRTQTKRNQKMKISLSLIKTSVDTLTKIMDHREEGISGPEDWVEELLHLIKYNNKP